MSTLNKNVLILNKNWSPVGVIKLQKAISLLFSTYENGEFKAKIVTPPPIGSYEVWNWQEWSCLEPAENEDFISGCRKKFKVPEVIILSKYDRIPMRSVNFCRKEVFIRDDYTCMYCGEKPPPNECTIDHITPISQNGANNWNNVALACKTCNTQKADRRPEASFKPTDKIKAKKWKGPSPMRLLKTPTKPEPSVFRTKVEILETWKNWVNELQGDRNDN